jgi:hypothetical protein
MWRGSWSTILSKWSVIGGHRGRDECDFLRYGCWSFNNDNDGVGSAALRSYVSHHKVEQVAQMALGQDILGNESLPSGAQLQTGC